MLIYCLKCREKTRAKKGHSKIYLHQKGRYRLSDVCSKCGKIKNVFINADTYQGLGSPSTKPYDEKPRKAKKKRKKEDKINFGTHFLKD